MSWEVIIPFLRPIEPFLRDPEISDVLVNGSQCVFVEKNGRLDEVPGVTLSEKSLQVAVRNIARVLGDESSPERPLLDSRLPDGSRVAAVMPPCSVTGTVLAIRKFCGHRYTAEELVRIDSLPQDVLHILRRAVEDLQLTSPTPNGTKILTISAGVALMGRSAAHDEDEVLRQADAQLYRAQRAGRNLARTRVAALPTARPSVRARRRSRTTQKAPTPLA